MKMLCTVLAITLCLSPLLIKGQGLCGSYKLLLDTDKSYSTVKCPTGNIPEKIFHGCLTTKGCVAPQDYRIKTTDDGCIENVNCDYVFAYGRSEDETNTPDELVMELYGKTQGWVAVAFSTDSKMGEDYVVECVKSKINISSDAMPEPTLHHSLNFPVGYRRRGVEITFNRRIAPTGNIRLIETIQATSSIYCKFYIKRQFEIQDPDTNKTYSIDFDSNKYCLLIAWSNKIDKTGSGVTGDKYSGIGSHDKKQRYSCKEQLSVSRQFVPTKRQVMYLEAHGVLMTAAWVFFMCMGNFIARYYKDVFPEPSWFKMQRWHKIHLIFVLLASLCMVAGTAFQILGMGGWESILGKTWFHSITGYFVLLFSIINFLMSFCLKSKSTDRLQYLAIAHIFLGYLLQTLAHLLIAEVHKVPFSSVSCVLGYMGISWTILYVFLNVFMSYHIYWVPCITGNLKDGEPETDVLSALTQSKSRPELQSGEQAGQGRAVRLGVLLIFGIICFLFMITMCLIISIPPVGPCFEGERPLYFEK